MTLTYQIIGAALEVHHLLGPGFLEVIYKQSLLRELNLRGLSTQTEVPVDVSYKDIVVGRHRLDVIVEKCVVLELKSVEVLADIHKAQTLSYLKATGLEVGLLLNFGETSLKWKRIANGIQLRELRELI